MKKHIFKLFFILFILPIRSYSQFEYSQELNNYIENNLYNSINSSFPILEQIDYFINNPINLYYASITQIESIASINYIDAYSIHNLFRNDDNIVTIDTIIKYINLTNIQQEILSLCTFINDKPDTVNNLDIFCRNRLTYQNLYNNKIILSNDNIELLQQYKASYKNYNIGITLNKGIQEKNIAAFYSGYIEYNKDNLQILLGDFEIQTGLGIICGGNPYLTKVSNILEPSIKYSNKILPYLSGIDNSLLRGITAKYTFNLFNKLNLTSMGWYSNKNCCFIDRTTTFYDIDYSTPKEHTKEEFTGAAIILGSCSYNLGINLSHYNYNIQNNDSILLIPKTNGILGSIFGIYNTDKIYFNGELTIDNNYKTGLKIGTAYQDKSFNFMLNLRSYDENFYSPFGMNIGESITPNNELGLNIGFVWKKDHILRNYTYIDWFKTYSPTKFVDTIINGLDLFTKFDINFSKKLSSFIQFQLKNNTVPLQTNNNITYYQQDKFNFQTELNYNINNKISIRNRIDIITIDKNGTENNETGIGLFIEGKWEISNNIYLQSKITYFSTDSYASAIKQFNYYTNFANIRSLYDKGTQSNISLTIVPTSYCKIYFSYENYYIIQHYINNIQNMVIPKNLIYCQIDFNF